MIPTRGNTVVNRQTLIGFSNGKFLFVSNLDTVDDHTSSRTILHTNILRSLNLKLDTDIMPTTIASRFYDLICWVAVKNINPMTGAFFMDNKCKIKCKLLAMTDYADDSSQVFVVYKNRKRIKKVRTGSKFVTVRSFLTTTTVSQFLDMENSK